jgi:enoyl-CoA hydratase/carnithine racemase
MAANKAGAMQNVVEVQKLFARVLTFPIPTVAAINGHAYAGNYRDPVLPISKI